MNPMTVFCDVHGPSKNILIPQIHEDNFLTMDSKENYERNLKSQPADWLYRHKKVNYTWNTNGYRCPEWNDIDWKNSIVVFGCSLIAGEGLDDTDTITSKMSAKLNCPVINLGVPAGSPDIIFYNTIRLVDLNIRPKAVCILSPRWERTTHFSNISKNLGPWTPYVETGFYADYYKKYVERPHNAEIHGYMSLRGAYESWKTTEVPVKMFEEVELHPDVDKSRDLKHPGIKTIELWAETMSEWINTYD